MTWEEMKEKYDNYTEDELLEVFREVYSEIPPERASTRKMSYETAKSLVQSAIIDCVCGADYTPEQLELIMKYLTIHLWQMNNGGAITSISAGAASESYQVSLDFFLKGTPQGQNAMLLDPNNCLAKRMADTDQALQGRGSYPPSIKALYYNYYRFRRSYW